MFSALIRHPSGWPVLILMVVMVPLGIALHFAAGAWKLLRGRR